MSKKRSVQIEFSGEMLLPLEDVVDGDIPDDVTIEMVRDAVEREGSKAAVMRDWNMIDAITVEISMVTYHDVSIAPLVSPPVEVWE